MLNQMKIIQLLTTIYVAMDQIAVGIITATPIQITTITAVVDIAG